MELFPFIMKCLLKNLFQGQFVPMHYASLPCIILYDICTSTYEQKISCSLFFCQEEKVSSSRQKIWWHTIYISTLQSNEKLINIYTLNLCHWELLAWLQNKDITAKHQDEGIASSTYCKYSCHFAGSTHFYFTKAGGSKMGLGGGGKG